MNSFLNIAQILCHSVFIYLNYLNYSIFKSIFVYISYQIIENFKLFVYILCSSYISNCLFIFLNILYFYLSDFKSMYIFIISSISYINYFLFRFFTICTSYSTIFDSNNAMSKQPV